MVDLSTDFEKELTTLINKYSIENESNTPDFILAEYVMACLEHLNNTILDRDDFYGVRLRPGQRYAHIQSEGVTSVI